MSKKSLLFISLVFLAANAKSGSASIKVIYGQDDRVDIMDSNNSLYIKLAKSTAAMISHSKLKEFNNSEIEIVASSLADGGVCESEPFSKQPAAANCSGFLVADNLLVTAGHCIRTQNDCDKYAWVFDYKVAYQDQEKVIVDKDAVYKCKSIVSQKLDSESKMDFAVIELDQKVKDRAPLKFRAEGKINAGDPLVVIGHPSGLPTKVADGATVRSVNDVYLVANLDTYGGNSGSAVFNSATGVVEGILVRGENDYVWNSSEGCRVSNQIANDAGRGEDVTLITAVEGLPVQSEPEEEEPQVQEPEDDEVATEPAKPEESRLAALLRILRLIFG